MGLNQEAFYQCLKFTYRNEALFCATFSDALQNFVEVKIISWRKTEDYNGRFLTVEVPGNV